MTTIDQKILIELELFGLERYLDLIEKSMPRLISDEREELLSLAKLFSKDDHESKSRTKLASVQADFLELYAIPKYVRNSFVVILWSFFEETTSKLAELYKDKIESEDPRHLISVKDLKGDVLTRLELFFDQDFVFISFTETSEMENLKLIYRIRNIIAHANGKLNSQDKKYLQKHHKPEMNLSYKEELVLTEQFLRWCYDEINTVTRKLLENLSFML